MLDNRNVIDAYKGWAQDLIKQDLASKTFSFAVLMEHIQGDFNIGTLIRNANAFGASGVFYVGKRQYDRRGAVGTQNYTNIKHIKTHEELIELKTHFKFIAVDNSPGYVSLETFQWPVNSLLIFGEECRGISSELLSTCDYKVGITQYGSVRSLNVGTASGIAMFDYVNKLHVKK